MVATLANPLEPSSFIRSVQPEQLSMPIVRMILDSKFFIAICFGILMILSRLLLEEFHKYRDYFDKM